MGFLNEKENLIKYIFFLVLEAFVCCFFSRILLVVGRFREIIVGRRRLGKF